MVWILDETRCKLIKKDVADEHCKLLTEIVMLFQYSEILFYKLHYIFQGKSPWIEVDIPWLLTIFHRCQCSESKDFVKSSSKYVIPESLENILSYLDLEISTSVCALFVLLIFQVTNQPMYQVHTKYSSKIPSVYITEL